MGTSPSGKASDFDSDKGDYLSRPQVQILPSLPYARNMMPSDPGNPERTGEWVGSLPIARYKWALNSIGQRPRLITGRFWVRDPEGPPYRGVAQLEAHGIWDAGAAGSSPATSTKKIFQFY